MNGKLVSHFTMKEFEDLNGQVTLDYYTLLAIEYTREELCHRYKEDVMIIITGATRTKDRNAFLGNLLGFLPNGLVARNSFHLLKYGGIALDLKALIKRTKEPVSEANALGAAGMFFDFVIGSYDDLHIHVDNRFKAQTIIERLNNG